MDKIKSYEDLYQLELLLGRDDLQYPNMSTLPPVAPPKKPEFPTLLRMPKGFVNLYGNNYLYNGPAMNDPVEDPLYVSPERRSALRLGQNYAKNSSYLALSQGKFLKNVSDLPPILPEDLSDQDPFDSACQEFMLIEDLNRQSTLKYNRAYAEMEKAISGNITEDDRAILILTRLWGRDALPWPFEPGAAVAADHLKNISIRWTAGSALANAKFNPDVFWTSWSWATAPGPAQEAIANLKLNLGLENIAARNALMSHLERLGKLGTEIQEFDFTASAPHEWDTLSYQARSINFLPDGQRQAHGHIPILWPQYWALGSFTVNALPKGVVIPLSGGGHRICISDVYLFISDNVNFEGDQKLGFWNVADTVFPSFSPFNRKIFNNEIFKSFRKRHGYGRDLMVLSPLKRIEDFAGGCWDIK